MTVNQRLVLLSIFEEVAGRSLGDGISADSPRRDVELSAPSPRGLLDRSQGQSRKSVRLERARTLDNQCINL